MALLPEQKKGVILLINADHFMMMVALTEVGAGVARLLAGEQLLGSGLAPSSPGRCAACCSYRPSKSWTWLPPSYFCAGGARLRTAAHTAAVIGLISCFRWSQTCWSPCSRSPCGTASAAFSGSSCPTVRGSPSSVAALLQYGSSCARGWSSGPYEKPPPRRFVGWPGARGGSEFQRYGRTKIDKIG